MYKYYILPLRVFFLKYKKRKTPIPEMDKFIDYIGLTLTHIGPPLVNFLLMFDKWGIKNYISIFICASILILYYAFGYRLFKYFVDMHDLTEAQANNQKLSIAGLFIFIEPLIFITVFWIYYFHFHLKKL